MMGLYFLVICSVGILRPIKNAVALAGLAPGAFYKVYFVSAAVALFVFPYNRLADRVPWKRLIPATAFGFAVLLLGFRLAYPRAGTAYGMLFYGWYDLYAAVMVGQFFLATQLYFDSRQAKDAYPLLIGAGSAGAVVGGAITGLTAEAVGIPNLLLLAAGVMVVFGLGLPLVWTALDEAPEERPGVRSAEAVAPADVREVLSDPRVRLIVVGVLLTVLLKQLVDYQFNTITEEVFVTAEAMSRFQGWFNAATQWLPLVLVAVLRPVLRRWGVAVALFLLPAFLLGANLALAALWTVAAAVVAKGGETGLRYSAERTAREILFLPVPARVKMKAKVITDIGVEKGLGKALSAVMIAGLAAVMDYRLVGWVGAAMALLWLPLALRLRREYVAGLARSLRQGMVRLGGAGASPVGAEALASVRRALEEGEERERVFALRLVGEAGRRDREALVDSLVPLLESPSAEVRRRALECVAGLEGALPEGRFRAFARDPEPEVRRAAVRAFRRSAPEPLDALRELLASDDALVRAAVLDTLLDDGLEPEEARVIREAYGPEGPGREVPRLERALAAAAFPSRRGGEEDVRRLVEDDDREVAAAALRSAGLLGSPRLVEAAIDRLADPELREPARAALAAVGPAAVPALARRLDDEEADPTVRRHVPSAMARLPCPEAVAALLDSYLAPETDQLLDFRTLKALNKLRAGGHGLDFPRGPVEAGLAREADAARRYAACRASLDGAARPTTEAGRNGDSRAAALLAAALEEAWEGRREAAFRCLGLLHDPDDVYRAYLAVTEGGRRSRAGAVEWLEEALDRPLFARLGPVLAPSPTAGPSPDPGSPPPAGELLGALARDKDRWIAWCAARAARELGADGDRPPSHHAPRPTLPTGNGTMELIDKVFLLRNVDVLEGAPPSHVALMASIAEEVEADPDTELARAGEPTDALYLVVEGAVELSGVDDQTLTARSGAAFGTWALIDEAPSLVGARVADRSRLLRIHRRDFHFLCTDRPEISLALLRGLARRVRGLVQP